jgi:hypothetical protein
VNNVNGREKKTKMYGLTGSTHFFLQVINYSDKEHISFHQNTLQFTAGMTSLRRKHRRNSDQTPCSLLQKAPFASLAKAILLVISW